MRLPFWPQATFDFAFVPGTFAVVGLAWSPLVLCGLGLLIMAGCDTGEPETRPGIVRENTLLLVWLNVFQVSLASPAAVADSRWTHSQPQAL